MFWGAFSYDRKGPCHVWEAETSQEKKQAEKDLQERNAELEPIMKADWNLIPAWLD